PADDRREDEHEHDQRRRQAYLELAVLEVGLRELAEVGADGVVPGDRRREAAAGGLPDGLDDRLRGAVALDRELEDGRVPVPRDGSATRQVAVAAVDAAGRPDLREQPGDEGP